MAITREESNLNEHIRRDALRRLWRLYILFLVASLFMSSFFMFPVDRDEVDRGLRQVLGRSPSFVEDLFTSQDPEIPRRVLLVPLILAATFPFAGLIAAMLLAQVEKPVYRLYTVLPMAARERGRRIWLRQAILAPATAFSMPVILTACFLNLEPSPWRAHMFMAAWRTFFMALAIPALMLLVSRRPLYDLSSRFFWLAYAITIPVALIHYWTFLSYGFGAFGAVSWIVFLTPIMALLGLSYARAPRLAIAGLAKEPAPKWPQVPNAPQSLPNFVFSTAMHTIGAAYLVFAILAVLGSVFDIAARTDRLFYFFAMDSMLAGIVTFTLFVSAGRFISEQMRLLRLLPLSPGKIALAALAYAVGVTALVMPGLVLVVALVTPGRPLLMMAGGLLLGADAGCLAAALQVRLGRWAAQVYLFLFAIFFLTIMTLSTPIQEQPAIVGPGLLRVLLAAFPVCLVIGFIAIRRAIKVTSAGVYGDFFLERFAPQ